MSDKSFEEYATATMNLESAIADYLRVAEKAGESDADALERLADGIYNASDGRLKVIIAVDE